MKNIVALIFKKYPRLYRIYIYAISRIFFTYLVCLKRIPRVRVMDEDWDYLIVLDACRYDYLEKYSNFKSVVKKRISIGSATPEWLKKSFIGYWEDIVYISANPFISNVEYLGFRGFEHFFKVEPVWDYGWDEETGTVHPKVLVDSALLMIKRFPSKRMIIHFLQPHAPYIGETDISRKTINVKANTPKDETIQKIWEMVRNGEISVSVLKKAYVDNLRLVLSEIDKLIENLRGKIVITSDHGECFGEWFIFGHPPGICVKELVEVPWIIIENGARELIDEGERKKTQDELKQEQDELVKKRLRDLGYLDD